MNYSVIVRAHQATPLLVRAVDCLRKQTCPPSEIIVVDSSGNPAEGESFRSLADYNVPYGTAEFNYSRAIHVGVSAAGTSHVLIHSAHVALPGTDVIEVSFRKAAELQCEVFYCRNGTELAYDIIDAGSFDGRNGLANSCAMIPKELLMQRGFREDVFSAEDQEWAAWFIREHKGSVLRVTTPSCVYENPHLNIQKKINENIAVAYFVNRHERWPHHIAVRLTRAALAALRGRPERAQLHWQIAKGLVASYFRKPERRSRYF